MIHIDNIPIIPGPIPPDVKSNDKEFDCGLPDLQSRARPTDPLERFIQELDDLAIMNGPDISALMDNLPVQQRGQVPSMAITRPCKRQ